VQAHRVGQRFDHADAVDAPRHLQGEASPAVLVDQRQDAKAWAVVSLSLHEVEAPDVIAVERTQPHAGTVVEPKSAARPVFLRDLQPLATPDAVNPVLAPCQPSVCSSAVTRR
jgi:hypothetical protein